MYIGGECLGFLSIYARAIGGRGQLYMSPMDGVHGIYNV